MGKVGKYYHYINATTVVSGVGTTYNASKKQTFVMSSQDFNGNIESLFITVSDIAGGCSALTVRICVDANGDYSAIGDVQVIIDKGITTATVGTCQILIDIPYQTVTGASPDNTLYVFFKCDAGSCNITQGQIGWSE